MKQTKAWAKEIPVKPGWYPVITRDGFQRVFKLVHEYGEIRWYWGFAILTSMPREVEVFGPRIEFQK